MGTAGQLALFQVIDKVQIPHDGHIHIERRQLRQIADASLRLNGFLQDILAVDERLTGSGADIAGQHVHGRGFSGAVRTKQTENLAVLCDKIDVADGNLIPVVFGQMFDFNHPCDCLLLFVHAWDTQRLHLFYQFIVIAS